ncbi:MAG: hypothetical protein ABI591_06205 [Kofleriaceae bacterium]
MLRTILISAVFATAAAGCYSEQPDVAYAGGGYVAGGLVEVSPGVDVIADYDYPVFYSDGLYWRYDGGIWYQSGFYDRGWGVAYNVPYGVRGIRNPGAYAHYGYGGIRDHRSGVRDHRSGGVVRGYGGYRGGAAVHPAYRGGGAVARPARGGGFRGGGHSSGHGGGHGRR